MKKVREQMSEAAAATPKAKVAEPPAFLGNEDGVTVSQLKPAVGGFSVSFAFDRQLAGMMDRVANATFNKETKTYEVPQASEPTLGNVVSAMRKVARSISDDLAAIQNLATESGRKAQVANGSSHHVTPQVSMFHEQERFYTGYIVNANAHFVAQLSGFGKQDGAAFVTLHRLADLDRSNLMKGDKVGIRYDARLMGAVTDLSKTKSVAELEADFKQFDGKRVDGVTVTDRGDKVGVAFDINPEMVARIRRVEGAAFHTTDKVWEVPKAKQEFALRAAQDLRHEFVLDAKDIGLMESIAEDKIDAAKVRKAFTKDGQSHFGAVLAVGERYALQKTGRGEFTLHHLASLDQKPAVNQNLAIEYQKGRGLVVDQDLKRAHGKAVGVGR